MLIHPTSLSETVDAVNESMVSGAKVSARDRTSIARWIAARQGLPAAYANTFAGFGAELRRGVRLFTGERVTSASARHILGQEACRAIRQLGVRDRAVDGSLQRATEGLLKCLARAAAGPRGGNPGLFCCGKCTVGLWRHLAVGGLDRQQERLAAGIGSLRSWRVGEGGWRAFPFWYTVLLLTEVGGPDGQAELRYAAPALKRAATRSGTSRYARRRPTIAARALAMI